MSLKVGDICIIDKRNISKNTESHPVEVVVTGVYGFIIKQYTVAMLNHLGHVVPDSDTDASRIYGAYLHKIKQHDHPVAIRFPSGMPTFSSRDLNTVTELKRMVRHSSDPALIDGLDILSKKINFYATDDVFGRDDRGTVAESRTR